MEEQAAPQAEPGQVQQFNGWVLNGDFENGPTTRGAQFIPLDRGSTALPNWTISDAGIDYILTYWQSAEGSRRSIDLNNRGSGAISQPINDLIPGIYHAVNFWLAGNPSCAPAVKTVRVEAAGQFADFTFDTTGRTFTDMGWRYVGFAFIPNSTSTTLTFRSLTAGACGPAIDGVILNAT